MMTDESRNFSSRQDGSTFDAREAIRLSEMDEYDNRERWHSVEKESLSEEYARRNGHKYIPVFSVALLLLVTTLAGSGGIFTAYYLHAMSRFRLPLPNHSAYRDTLLHWTGYYENDVSFCDVQEPTCFFTAQDKFYIGEGQPPSLLEFSSDGTLLQTIPLESEPIAVVIGGAGQLFEGKIIVSHRTSIAVYSPDGQQESLWRMPGEKPAVWSLALSEDSLYVADSGERVVYRFDGDGSLIQTIGGPPDDGNDGSDADGFGGFAVYKAPIMLAVSPKTGLLHVTNPGKHKIEIFTSDGHWEPSLSWGYVSSDIVGFSGCCNPVSLLILDDGRVVTAEKSIVRVKVYQTNRRLDCFVAGPEVLDRKPQNVPQLESFRLTAVHNDRTLFLGAMSGKEIAVFDPVLRVVRRFMPL